VNHWKNASCGPKDEASSFAMRRRHSLVLVAWTLAFIELGAVLPASSAEIRRAGKLTVPRNVALVAFSTDPTVAYVLSQDLIAARRSGGADGTTAATVTVTVSQRSLKPGVTLGQLAAGDANVAGLIRAAGATPPPLGDTGNQVDEAAMARSRFERQLGPGETPMQSLINKFQEHGDLGPPMGCDPRAVGPGGCEPEAAPTPRPIPGSPNFTGDTADYLQQANPHHQFIRHDDDSYDIVIVARASLKDGPEEMTVVAVMHPGEDAHDVKKLVAEEIANAILH